MAYIGARPTTNFRVAPTKDTFTGDGSTTTFDLTTAIPDVTERDIDVFVENVRQEPNISLVIFHPNDMYTCWEIRGNVEKIVQDPTANEHIDYLSNRYTGKPYGRTEEVTWDEAGFTNREIWEIKVSKVISMVSRAQEKSDSE